MSCTCDTSTLPCGSCAGDTALTPVALWNRPALGTIAYRTGTYGSFKASMLSALSGSTHPELAGLRTRASSDFSIALVDSWAVTLDILTFYQERLANEAYLGTALEARSVFELARLVGYQPSPGVSASAILTFFLATAPGSPLSAPLSAGTRVQSIPKPGQQPQVFETSQNLIATIAGNAIPAATTQPWKITGSDQSTWLAGTATNLQPGDCLLFLSAPGGKPSTTGPANVRYVAAVTPDVRAGRSRVQWDQPLSSDFSAGSSEICVYAMRKKAALNGAQAPHAKVFPATVTAPPTDRTDGDWKFTYAGDGSVSLDNTYPGLSPAAASPNGSADKLQWAVLASGGSTAFFQIESVTETNPALYTLSAKTTKLTFSTGKGLDADASLNLDQLLTNFVTATRSTTAFVQSELLPLAEIPLTAWALTSTYSLTPGMLAPVTGSVLTLRGGQWITSGQPVGVTGKRLRVEVANASLVVYMPQGSTQQLAVSQAQSFLVDAFPPVEDGAKNFEWQVLTEDGNAGTLVALPGAVRLAPAQTADPSTGEAGVVNVEVHGSTTEITFAAPLRRIYDAGTVTVNANAVMATHGETTQEILGSGDALNEALTLPLKTGPLTYTSSSSANGSLSSLEVRVNNLRWKEVPNFINSGPADRVYVTHASPDGKVTVQFGNGLAGARTPTGTSNLRAFYRKGTGSAGMVDPGQLTMPLDRPQGLQSVTNPGAASGGADPSTPADARERAPLPTLTLGRVVSLEDYQNFAQAFAGIAKALATWTWFGSTRGVFLTVAGDGGAQLNANDPIFKNLFNALTARGLPHLPLQIASYIPVLFSIKAQLKVDTDVYDPVRVSGDAWSKLVEAFSFSKMQPGDRIASSRVIAILQSTPGVIAVDLTQFERSGQAAVATTLCAAGPKPPKGAEVFLLDPASQNGLGVWS
jgi:hypothetical protein